MITCCFISEGGVNEEIVGVETKDVAVPSHQEVLKKYFKVRALLSLVLIYITHTLCLASGFITNQGTHISRLLIFEFLFFQK